jgi:uncharacterized small protein (DUF1192 family)
LKKVAEEVSQSLDELEEIIKLTESLSFAANRSKRELPEPSADNIVETKTALHHLRIENGILRDQMIVQIKNSKELNKKIKALEDEIQVLKAGKD